MMMKRILIISLLSIALAAVVVILATRRMTSSGYDLKVPEGAGVTRIVIQNRVNRIVLEEAGESWHLNGRGDARKTAVDLILTELEEMEPRSPVSESIVNSLKSKMSGSEVSVKVFSKGRKIRSFTVSHYKDKDYPSLFRKKNNSQALLFYLPGYDIDPGSVFIADERYWSPFTIFKIRQSEIKEVNVDYPADHTKSFCIVNHNGRVSIKDMASFDTLSVRRYLSYFLNVPFESINTSLTTQEERAIEGSQPYVNISVTTTDGTVNLLKGWKKTTENGTRGEDDTDRLWGQLNGGNLFVMRYFDVDPLLKKRSYFQQVK